MTFIRIQLLAVLGGVACAHLAGPLPLAAQSELISAVEDARAAWLEHDLTRLVVGSDTVRLHIPGVGRAPVVHPSQAARVLHGYLKTASEISLVLGGIREVSQDHAYAQLQRRYVVEGTSDERVETVFFGFRLVEDIWRLREVRITP